MIPSRNAGGSKAGDADQCADNAPTRPEVAPDRYVHDTQADCPRRRGEFHGGVLPEVTGAVPADQLKGVASAEQAQPLVESARQSGRGEVGL